MLADMTPPVERNLTLHFMLRKKAFGNAAIQFDIGYVFVPNWLWQFRHLNRQVVVPSLLRVCDTTGCFWRLLSLHTHPCGE